MFELKIVTDFAAAHQLEMVAKKCENLHGHNWKIEVFVKGPNLNDAGVLIDFGELKLIVKDIIKDLDHHFLNELPHFKGLNPSSENIAKYIAQTLSSRLNEEGVTVSRVTAWESDDACATYFPET